MSITLLNINPQNVVEDGIKPLMYSCKNMKFDMVVLLTPELPKNLPNNITWKKISPMSLVDYNKFMIKNLHQYIDTDFCLIIQGDGFVIHPENWTDEFLKYDYIGAPWRNLAHYSFIRVGNGGFCLRSKKFLNACKYIQPSGFNEDHELCISYRNYFLNSGIKFAPVELAVKFSKEFDIEIPITYEQCFGFHGNKEMAKELLSQI